MRWSMAPTAVGNAMVDGADRGWQCDGRRRCRAVGNAIVAGAAARPAMRSTMALRRVWQFQGHWRRFATGVRARARRLFEISNSQFA
jgi:hypothetical protein